ncbi:MAG TPA: glycoside hydrolase family 3 N-terminal domain-containing protein, partial [Lachnospiraceae bacterium]|nr:glycoside hydrolase family 3 N-terminal domain-containing protein [Lachnospiraceae bacterium]
MEYETIISKMSLEDKVALGSGKDFWNTKDMVRYGIKGFTMADGPHGVRRQQDQTDMLGINQAVPATCFPTAVLSACSWDEELLEQMGTAIAKEAKANGISVVLGPGANIKRNPLCGRNFEYFSEDPYLTGKLAAAYIKGVEHEKISAGLKH